jgi:hypothetical protein
MPQIRVERIHYGFLVAPDGSRDPRRCPWTVDLTVSQDFLGEASSRPATGHEPD